MPVHRPVESVDLLPVPPRPRGAYTVDTLKRQFSESLARTMAASLNVKCTVFPSGDDIDSVDVEFDTGRFGPRNARLGINRKLEVQLKCTTGGSLTSMVHPHEGTPCYRFYLSVKDYERLAIASDQRPYPHVLVVVRVPPSPLDWIVGQGPLTLLRAKAWWLDLTDFPAATHTTSEPVYLPKTQVFDIVALDALMQEPK